jgi:hypothetical protein
MATRRFSAIRLRRTDITPYCAAHAPTQFRAIDLTEAIYPSEEHAHLVTRTTFGPVAHDWTANDDDAGEHHGAIDVNEAPCYLALYWQSRRAGRTVHVGTYKLNLHRLERAGYARAEGARKVRLRFVREADGLVVIQINGNGPRLPVGRAEFA